MKSFWDKVAPIYDLSEKINGKVYSAMLGYSKSLVPDGAEVLECAAGTGEISIAVSGKAKHIVCTDQSKEMLDKAKDKCRVKGIDNIVFEERNIFHLADNDETYDVVIAANVLHLIENPENAVKELMRVLKKDGRLLIPTFVTRYESGKVMPIINAYKLFGFKPSANFNPQTYLEMLKKCGVKGKIKMRVIDGLIPLAYAVIEKY